MAKGLEKYTELFLEEAGEMLDSLNASLILLEKEGYDLEVINEIFRTAHTMKSSAAFVGLDSLSELHHKMEDLLSLIKDGKAQITTEIVNILFACLDRTKAAVSVVAGGRIPDDSFHDLISALAAQKQSSASKGSASSVASSVSTSESGAGASSSSQASAPASPSSLSSSASSSASTESSSASSSSSASTTSPSGGVSDSEGAQTTVQMGLDSTESEALLRRSNDKKVYDGLVRLDRDAPMKNMRYLLLLQHLKKKGDVFKCEPAESILEGGGSSESFRFLFITSLGREEVSQICQVDMVEEVRIVDHNLGAKRSMQSMASEETTLKTRNIKVSSEKIDYLLNSVGELVITNSGLLKIYEDLIGEFGESAGLSELKGKIDQAARIARDLQSGIMKTRMIPVGIAFHRFTRPVRDLALELGKDVELVFQGEDTELDKNIIDALNDPLLHLIRNALDHGIETPEERKSKGKPPHATLLLNSYQSGNNIYVEIRDDGRGLDVGEILKRARAQKLISADATLSEVEIFDLIFQSGFSTKDQVTEISGRGVGMSVVKKMVQEFKGSVSVQNEPGLGCTFILAFPLTLAIISAILVKISGEEYAFPLSDVVETIRVTKDDITTLQGKDIINLRGDILPVFKLSGLMGIHFTPSPAEFPVVIANVNNRKVGFIVDGMMGKKEIVIKSLEKNFTTVVGLIGACLMGDGSIVMVLDVQGLLELAQRESNKDPSLVALEQLTATESLSVEGTRAYNSKVLEITQRARRFATTKKVEKRLGSNGHGLTHVSGSSSREKPFERQLIDDKFGSPKESTSSTGTESFSSIPMQPTTPYSVEAVDFPEIDLSTPSTPISDDERLSKALSDFEIEKEQRKETAQELITPDQMIDPDISERDYQKIYAVINTGMVNAGLVLSQLLGVTVEVSVPEFKTVEISDMVQYLPKDNIIGVMLDTTGDYQMVVNLVFDEKNGYKAAGDLMGLSVIESEKGKINEDDLESVLSELTNIVGSSILNEIANKTEMSITPHVPVFFHGRTPQMLEELKTRAQYAKMSRAIYVSADFYRDEMELLGKVFLIPSRTTLTQIVSRL